MSNEIIADQAERHRATKTTRRPLSGWKAAVAAGLVGLPLVAAAGGVSLAQSEAFVQTPVAPVAVSALSVSGATAARGEVAEIFGNKFILQDASGRALVDTGREGEGGSLVTKGENVTVQGPFEKGFLRARLITRADGRQVSLGRGGPRAGTVDWAKEKVGLGPSLDVLALTGVAERAGYTDIRLTGRGPKHLELAAKKDGQERVLHVGADGRIRERSL